MALIFRKHEGATFKVHAYPGRDQKILRKPCKIPPRPRREGPELCLERCETRLHVAKMNPSVAVMYFLPRIPRCRDQHPWASRDSPAGQNLR